MAILAAGNCLDLMHTKAAPRWIWIAFNTGVAVFMASILAAANSAWDLTDIARLASCVSFAMGAVIPLACSTARAFADAMVPWFACAALSLLLLAAADGRYGDLATRALFFSAQIVALRFRPKYSLVVFVVTLLLLLPMGAITECAFTHVREKRTFARCIVQQLQFDQALFFVWGSLVVFFVGRKYANDFSARRAARESREQHRYATVSLARSLKRVLVPSFSLSLSLALALAL